MRTNFNPETLKSFNHYDREIALYSIDKKFMALHAKDIVPISDTTEDRMGESFIQITNHYKMKIGDYVAKQGNNYFIQQSIKQQLALDTLEGNEKLEMNVYEFKRTYRWEFEKDTVEGS